MLQTDIVFSIAWLLLLLPVLSVCNICCKFLSVSVCCMSYRMFKVVNGSRNDQLVSIIATNVEYLSRNWLSFKRFGLERISVTVIYMFASHLVAFTGLC